MTALTGGGGRIGREPVAGCLQGIGDGKGQEGAGPADHPGQPARPPRGKLIYRQVSSS